MRTVLLSLILAASGYSHAHGAEPTKELAKARYTTPEELFKAYREASQKNDSRTYWNCCTPQMQKELLYEQYFASAMRSSDPRIQAIWKKHGLEEKKLDEQFNKEYQKRFGVAWDKEKPFEQEMLRDVISDAIVDQLGFSEAISKFFQKSDKPTKIGELQSLSIVGNRAVVYTTIVHYSYSQEPGQPGKVHENNMPLVLVFCKTEKGWLIGTSDEEE